MSRKIRNQQANLHSILNKACQVDWRSVCWKRTPMKYGSVQTRTVVSLLRARARTAKVVAGKNVSKHGLESRCGLCRLCHNAKSDSTPKRHESIECLFCNHSVKSAKFNFIQRDANVVPHATIVPVRTSKFFIEAHLPELAHQQKKRCELLEHPAHRNNKISFTTKKYISPHVTRYPDMGRSKTLLAWVLRVVIIYPFRIPVQSCWPTLLIASNFCGLRVGLLSKVMHIGHV